MAALKQSCENARVRVSWNRGYASLVGGDVEDTVKSFLVPDIDAKEYVRSATGTTKSEPFHITIFTKDELRSLGIEKVKKIKEGISSLNTDFISLGIGGANGYYFHVVVFPGGDKLRKKYGLPEKQFHITLTDKDDHTMDKSIKSLLFVNDTVTETPWNIISCLDRSDAHEILHHFYLQQPSQKLLSQFLLRAINASSHPYYDLLEFIAHEMRLHPDWISTYLGAGAIFSKWKQHGCGWKLAMLCYMSVLHHPMDLQSGSKEIQEDYLKDRIIRCSQHTEWGLTFTETEMLALKEDTHCLSFFSEFLIHKSLDLVSFSSITESIDPPSLSLQPRTRMQIPLNDGSWYELPRFFRWIIPGSLCAMSTPRNKRDVEVLAQPPISIETIVTLTEEEPLPKEWFHGTNVENVFLPVTNYRAPTYAQVDTFVNIVTGDAIKGVNGKTTLIHCGGGKGRAGTFLACYIAACGFSLQRQATPVFSAKEAIDIIRNMRPGSVETAEQETFIASYISHLWKQDRNALVEPEYPMEVIGLPLSKAPALIVCCGLQGSGKSYVSAMLKEHLSYEVISQDELGSKDACFSALENAVKKKSKVIIDRCNPDAKSRREWLEAASYPSDTICLYFDYPMDLCIQRCDSRTNHPTIKQGRSSAPVKGMAKMLQPPILSEGFKSIVTIPSITASNEFIKNMGASEDVKAEIKPNIIKFPRTRHLFNLGSASRDDLILESSDASSFLHLSPGERLVLQEKVDGANMGISIDKDSLNFKVQNRSHYINYKTHVQFKDLDKWLNDKRESLYKILTKDGEIPPGSLILYGEWVAARHSIHYSHLPDKFLAFDIYDIDSKTFYTTTQLGKALENTGIQRPIDIQTIEYQDGHKPLVRADFIRMVSEKSKYYKGPVEGIYVRKETSSRLLDRAKVVRNDFICGNEHWSKGIITWNVIDYKF